MSARVGYEPMPDLCECGQPAAWLVLVFANPADIAEHRPAEGGHWAACDTHLARDLRRCVERTKLRAPYTLTRALTRQAATT